MTTTPSPKATPRYLADGTYLWEAYNTLSGHKQSYAATVFEGQLVGFYIDSTGAAASMYDVIQDEVFALVSKALVAGTCLALLRAAPRSNPAPIGVKEGRALHLTLVDCGVPSRAEGHNVFASEVLGFEVRHFRHLTHAQAREVRMAAVRRVLAVAA